MYWPSLSRTQISKRVFQALHENVDYRTNAVLGIPATYLDPDEFYPDAPFLKDAPFMSTLIANPNHIGCHTLVEPGPPFAGTQRIERELINLCAEQIFGGEARQQDGYVASGGTEANIQAMWTYRNYFKRELGAAQEEIAIMYSEDSHYSMPKGSDLLNLRSIIVPVDEHSRYMKEEVMKEMVTAAKNEGIKYIIAVVNMSTTMFGSVDNIDTVVEVLEKTGMEFRIHVDGAFGGFIYPFTCHESKLTFKNKNITSFTLDGHKMLQTPYGTGIFLVRKNYMEYVKTEQASYIPGKDYTLCGSRSGANAVSVWMILNSHGSEGWKVKMNKLLDRTNDLCSRLDKIDVPYFRNAFVNIVTIPAGYMTRELADKFLLVADAYDREPKWFKIVMMDHITRGTIDRFVSELSALSVK